MMAKLIRSTFKCVNHLSGDFRQLGKLFQIGTILLAKLYFLTS